MNYLINYLNFLSVYFTVTANSIISFAGLGTLIFFILSIFTVIGSIADSDENMRKRCSKASRYTITVFIITAIIFILTPSTKQCCAIIILPKIMKGEKINEDDKIYQLCLEWFNDVKSKDRKDENTK